MKFILHHGDPNLLSQVLTAALPQNFKPEETYELVWVCQKSGVSHTYDITQSMKTLNMLTSSCSHDALFSLFDGWLVMNSILLAFCHGNSMIFFHPDGIAHVHSTRYENEVLHVNDQDIFNVLRHYLQ